MAESTKPISAVAAEYWDANCQKSLDETFWMAHPICRQAINRRTSGSPHEWPLDWFKRVYCQTPFSRGISWGCGLGAFERSAIRRGVVTEIDAFDISPASLRDAEFKARQEGIAGIRYQIGNFDDPQLQRRRYDIVFFHASLHHVAALERLFRRLAFALKPGGIVYVDEFVGPSRDRWSNDQLHLAQAVLDMAPGGVRTRTKLDFPIEVNDPSEGVRCQEIPRFLREFFDILEWRPYGGQIADLVIPCLDPRWVVSPEGNLFVDAMLRVEDDQLARDASSTHHAVAVGRLKPLPRLLWPLGQQVRKAIARRLRARRSLASSRTRT